MQANVWHSSESKLWKASSTWTCSVSVFSFSVCWKLLKTVSSFSPKKESTSTQVFSVWQTEYESENEKKRKSTTFPQYCFISQQFLLAGWQRQLSEKYSRTGNPHRKLLWGQKVVCCVWIGWRGGWRWWGVGRMYVSALTGCKRAVYHLSISFLWSMKTSFVQIVFKETKKIMTKRLQMSWISLLVEFYFLMNSFLNCDLYV